MRQFADVDEADVAFPALGTTKVIPGGGLRLAMMIKTCPELSYSVVKCEKFRDGHF
jgi:hypothetical protein